MHFRGFIESQKCNCCGERVKLSSVANLRIMVIIMPGYKKNELMRFKFNPWTKIRRGAKTEELKTCNYQTLKSYMHTEN